MCEVQWVKTTSIGLRVLETHAEARPGRKLLGQIITICGQEDNSWPCNDAVEI
jgi:hypothetical protein